MKIGVILDEAYFKQDSTLIEMDKDEQSIAEYKNDLKVLYITI